MILVLAAAAVAITVSLPILSMLSGAVIPFLTELVTKDIAAPSLRIALLCLLAAVAGTVTSIVTQGGTFVLLPTLYAALLAFVTALASHYGFTNVTGALPALRAKTANFGLGGGSPKAPAAQ